MKRKKQTEESCRVSDGLQDWCDKKIKGIEKKQRIIDSFVFESQEELKWNPIMPFLITVRPSSQVILSESWPQIRDCFKKLIEVDNTIRMRTW